MAVGDASVRVGSRGSGRLGAAIRARGAGPWNRDAVVLAMAVVVLVVVGLVMSFSASFVDAAETGDPFGTFRRQLVWAAIGVPLFALTATLDHRLWRGLSWLLLGAALLGLLAVLVPGVGVTVAGSTRWVALGPVVVQPSELAKLATLLWLADVIARKRSTTGGVLPTRHLLVPALPLLAIEAVLIIAQPDLGTTLLLGLIVMLVLYIEGLPMRTFGTFALTVALFGAAAAVAAPYRLARVTGWLDPEADPLGSGYQLLQSLYALGGGGWSGIGLGSSRGKWNFVPNPETDFIFAIIGEELGLVGSLSVLLAFALVLVVGLRIARRARDGFGRTVAFTITGWIVGQALLNVGTVTGLLPITGVTLPLVSVGGSSLVSTLVALGILVAVSRDTSRVAVRPTTEEGPR